MDKDKEDIMIGNLLNSNDRVLRILKEQFYDRPSYTRGDAFHTAFNEGQRDVVGYLIGCCEFATQKVKEGTE